MPHKQSCGRRKCSGHSFVIVSFRSSGLLSTGCRLFPRAAGVICLTGFVKTALFCLPNCPVSPRLTALLRPYHLCCFAKAPQSTPCLNSKLKQTKYFGFQTFDTLLASLPLFYRCLLYNILVGHFPSARLTHHQLEYL